MPNKPLSHSQRERKRLGRTLLDKEYEGRRRSDPALALAHRLRNTPRWRKVRALKLARDPLCEECQEHGVVEPATQVHHVIQLTKRPNLAYDLDNTRSLCTTCHARESARERRGP